MINSSRKTLVLDLDETLFHSDFRRPNRKPDIAIKINVEGTLAEIYVFIRPHVKQFLEKMALLYEIVIFTASLSNYANEIIDRLPNSSKINSRLYRQHCNKTDSEIYIKEMKKLGRSIKDVVIIDSNPPSYTNGPLNGIPILTWIDDPEDNELLKYVPMLEFLANVDDVRLYIPKFVHESFINYSMIYKVIMEETQANVEECAISEMNYKENCSNRYSNHSSQYGTNELFSNYQYKPSFNTPGANSRYLSNYISFSPEALVKKNSNKLERVSRRDELSSTSVSFIKDHPSNYLKLQSEKETNETHLQLNLKIKTLTTLNMRRI